MNRRTLLRGAGGIALGLPLLDIMIPRNPAQAQALMAPPRFGLFFSSCGVVSDYWWPTGTERAFELNANMQPLLSYKEKLVVLEGLSALSSELQTGNPHDVAMVHLLTATPFTGSLLGMFTHLLDGTAGGPSVDQVIANHIGGDTQLRSLELGVESSITAHPPLVKRMSYGGAADPRDPMDDPVQVFARLMGDKGDVGTAAEVSALHAQRRTVLDAVQAEFQSTRLKLGSEDRAKLDRHATAVREIEERIGIGGVADCKVPAVPPAVKIETVACQRNGSADMCLTGFAEVGRAQMDLMVLALACDMTRVVSLQWSTAESTKVFDVELGFQGEHHRMSHDYGNRSLELSAITTWYAQQFAYLLGELQKVSEGGGTLLDNLLLCWCNELSEAETHSRRNLPFVLAGSAGGKLETNRYLKIGEPAGAPAVPHSHLYSTLLQMFGVPDAGFGQPEFRGVLPGLV
jgi:hypothetical protein